MSNRHFSLLLWVVLLTLPIFAQKTTESLIIDVPKGSSITVDGKMNEDEWKDALTKDLKGGGSIKFKHDGEFLLIGLHGENTGISHVYLTNNKFFVLHASASLGMAIYEQGCFANPLLQKFKWELKDQATNAEASAEYLKINGWLASVTSPPSSEREYKISKKFQHNGIFYMAAVYMSNSMSPQFYPDTLRDDTLKKELLFGIEHGSILFSPDKWATLKLKEK